LEVYRLGGEVAASLASHFYSTVFSFQLPDPVEAVEIANL
jgi:hypothetical protein